MELKSRYRQTEVGMIPLDWVVRSLGQLGEFRNGINKRKEDFGHGYPFVNLLDVFGLTKLYNGLRFDLVNSTQTEKTIYQLKKGDVLFVRSSVKPEGVGLTTLVAEDLRDTVYSGFLIRFRDSGALAYEFKEHCFGEWGFRRRLISSSTVSANTNINQNALKAIQIAFPPSTEEQRAIAAALRDVDDLISSLDQLIAKKRVIKQGAMQQLLTGKQRLPGFSGEWEVKKLGDIAEIQRGASPRPIDSPIWYDSASTVGWVRISDVTESNGQVLFKTKDYLSEKGIAQSRFLPQNSLIMSICATVGIPVITAIDTCIHDGFVGFSKLNQTDKVFLYYKLKELEPGFRSMGQTGSQRNLNSDLVRNCIILLPSIHEQQAIATILSDMDVEIAALEQKRDKTRALKQGMMQELLTGRTRLV